MFFAFLLFQAVLSYEDAFDQECAQRLIEKAAQQRNGRIDEQVARIVDQCSRPFRPLARGSDLRTERHIYDTARARFAFGVLGRLFDRQQRSDGRAD